MPSTVAGVNYSVMFPLLFISFLTFSLLVFSLYTIRRRRQLHHHHRESPPLITDIDRTINCNNHSTITENLKSIDSNCNNNQTAEKSESPATGEDESVKKKKRKKKKKSDCDNFSKNRVVKEKEKDDLVCLYPFTSSSSATQRKIKQEYDQLVKSHDSNGLTLLQVGQFVNCLIEARDELKHKSEVIRRKFTITKALLLKADRSSFDRLRQQIYKLELEQKRVEEDASVYNWLQQQLKLSPAYKKMLEIGAKMESKPKSVEPTMDTDSDVCDISFEELLAQEKKDYSFWQKKGKPRSGSG